MCSLRKAGIFSLEGIPLEEKCRKLIYSFRRCKNFSHTRKENKLLWKASSNGIFSVSSCYKILNAQQQGQSRKWPWKMIWKTAVRMLGLAHGTWGLSTTRNFKEEGLDIMYLMLSRWRLVNLWSTYFTMQVYLVDLVYVSGCLWNRMGYPWEIQRSTWMMGSNLPRWLIEENLDV